MAEERPMQEPTHVYRARPVLTGGLVVLAILATVAGAAGAARVGADTLGPFTSGVAFGAAAVVAWLLFLRVTGWTLIAYPEWFHLIGPRRGYQVRWDLVDRSYASPAAVTDTIAARLAGRYEYRLVVGERTFQLGVPVGADRTLGELIGERTADTVRTKVTRRLVAGREVALGMLTLGPAGLTVGGIRPRRIAFEDLDDVRVAGTRLEIRHRGRRRPTTVPVARVPDVALVVDLVRNPDTWRNPAAAPRPAAA